jgi:hypothetical protein
MCGLSSLPSWPGRSLFSAPERRALFGFECRGDASASFFVLERTKKVLYAQPGGTLESPRLLGAFDLEEDPGELFDRSTEAWPAEVAERYAPELRTALAQLVRCERKALDPARAAELEKLGY